LIIGPLFCLGCLSAIWDMLYGLFHSRIGLSFVVLLLPVSFLSILARGMEPRALRLADHGADVVSLGRAALTYRHFKLGTAAVIAAWGERSRLGMTL
jgi:hypothetical protein